MFFLRERDAPVLPLETFGLPSLFDRHCCSKTFIGGALSQGFVNGIDGCQRQAPTVQYGYYLNTVSYVDTIFTDQINMLQRKKIFRAHM